MDVEVNWVLFEVISSFGGDCLGILHGDDEALTEMEMVLGEVRGQGDLLAWLLDEETIL